MLLRNYLPLEKGMALHWTDLYPHHPQMVLEKKIKMWKVYRQTYRWTYDGQNVIRKAHLARWAKKGFLFDEQLSYMVITQYDVLIINNTAIENSLY